MAGLAETCTHVGALLFKVEATVRIRGTKTVTDEPAYWMLPGNLKKIHPEVGHKIDYSTSASQKTTLDKKIQAEVSTPARRSCPQKRKIPPANLKDLCPLLDTLLEHSKAVGLSGMEKYYTLFTHKPEQSIMLPKSLASLYNNMQSHDLSAILQCCEKYKDVAAVTDEQAEAIEKHTRLQHKCSAWYECRAGQITSSTMHAVFATSLERPALTVVKQVWNPGNTVSTVQTKWGVNHEGDAQKAYIKIRARHKNQKVKSCGFIINTDFPELGASPDGLTTCDCCGNGCLEIKCPYKYRTSCIQQAVDANDKNFFLQLSGNELHLKKHHPYYTQVQTEIFVTKSNHCDLVVCTEKDMAIVRVFPDQEFWEPHLQKAQSFFKNICLPELVGRYFSEHTCTPASRET
uniref:YqaJ viral recombinase domain-containing protein n=1 Tax=Kryptolebias marmoratus TaxID=37003 RepID=A0A3Q3ANK9_KRYMA